MEAIDRALDGGIHGTVLVSHCDVDGSFLVHHFIGNSLRSSFSKVVVVGLCQTFTHYNSVGQKMGWSLATTCEQEKLIFIDCLSRSAAPDREREMKCVETQKGRWRLPLDMPRPLETLGRLVASQLSQESKERSRRSAIIIDDLAMLLHVGMSIQDLTVFLTFCERLLHCNTSQPGSLVCFLRCDADVDDHEARRLLLHLQHRCQRHVQLSGLSTGYSQLVHGNMLVERRDPLQFEPGNILRTEMQYRVLDKSVTVFPKGVSSDVL